MVIPLVGVVVALVCAGFASSSAVAGQYTWCFQSTDHNCPDGMPTYAVGERHTFIYSYGQWGSVVHSGCNLWVDTEMYVAYVNSNAYNYKYHARGCNTIYQSFPANTELLRGLVYHENWGQFQFLLGNGGY
jgi:hypothetical protein